VISVAVLSPEKHSDWLNALRLVVGDIRVVRADGDEERLGLLNAGVVDAIVVSPLSTRAHLLPGLRLRPASPAATHPLFGLWRARTSSSPTVAISCTTVVHWVYDNVDLPLPSGARAVCISNPRARASALERGEVCSAILPVGVEPAAGTCVRVITSDEAPAPLVGFRDTRMTPTFERAAVLLGFPADSLRRHAVRWTPSRLDDGCGCTG